MNLAPNSSSQHGCSRRPLGQAPISFVWMPDGKGPPEFELPGDEVIEGDPGHYELHWLSRAAFDDGAVGLGGDADHPDALHLVLDSRLAGGRSCSAWSRLSLSAPSSSSG